MPEWRNWQTHGTQNPALFATCGFDPHLRHHFHSHSPRSAALHFNSANPLMAIPNPPSSGQALALCLLAWLPAPAAADDARFLPFMGPRIEAARYSPANEEFAWVGWIGATVDLVERGKWSAYFDPGVETILGHRVRSFEAVQANYSLEVGLRRDLGRGRLAPFLHHVSRHVQDRDKYQTVDWNFLGLAWDSPWPKSWDRRGAYSMSVAVSTLSSGVDYDWEGRAAFDIDVARKGSQALFILADVRYVGANPGPGFPRGSFADFRAEAGFRRFQASSQFALFAAYEHRNDALIPTALVIDRALFGFRIRGQRRSSPAILPLP